MPHETLFSVANAFVVPFWILLIAFPRSGLTRKLVHSILPYTILGAFYIALLFLAPNGPDGGGFGTLAGVGRMFENKTILLAGWVHYLAFDLFVGAWIGRDAAKRSLSVYLVIPSLVATFFFGPIGLLAYLATRFLKEKSVTID